MCSYLHKGVANIHMLMMLKMISFYAENKVNLHTSFEGKVTSLTLHLVVYHKALIFKALKNVLDKICRNQWYKHYV